MSVEDFLSWITQAIFLLIFGVVAVHAVRRPRRASIDTAVFFGLFAFLFIAGDVLDLLGIPSSDPGRQLMSLGLVAAMPYALLRLVDDFARQPRWLMLAAPASLLVIVAVDAFSPEPRPLWVAALAVGYFVALGGYSAVQFVIGGRQASGVTGRRMQAVAAGMGLVAAALVIAVVALALPVVQPVTSVVTQALALISGIAFYVGFAPPQILRRAWQEPELRTFLGRAAVLPRLPNTRAIIRELESSAARALGAEGAAIGVWEPDRRVLRWATEEGGWAETRSGEFIGGRAYAEQRAIFSTDAVRDDPAQAQLYAEANARAVMAAPVSAGERRLGVLTVWASREPIFVDEDLRLVKLLADQAAVTLESRALIDEAAAVKAREEAARLKEDFLSAAAHDLRTPLTTVLIHAELLEREQQRSGPATGERSRVSKIVAEAHRLRSLVNDLLDAGRAERGQLVAELERVDLVVLAREVAARHATRRHPCRVDADGPLVGRFDPGRIGQLIENLVSNAVKYSPDGGEVVIGVRRDGSDAVLEVSDHGIGIPAADLPQLFGRFHRAANVDDRRFAGMGLGLFICRAIAEAHGGAISATSRVGAGTTFRVRLPLADDVSDADQAAQRAGSSAAGGERPGEAPGERLETARG